MIPLSQERGFVRGAIIAAVSVLLAACFDYLVFGKTVGLGFPLFVLLVLALSFAVVPRRRFQTEFLWVLIPLLFFSWMVFVRASVLLMVLNILATILLFLLLADLMTGKKLRSFLLRQYADIVVLPLKFLQPLGETLSDVVSLRGVHQHSDVVSRILKGLFMAIPVLMIFAVLFSLADLLFAKYLTEMFTFDWDGDTVARVVRLVVITCAFIGAYSYVVKAPQAPHASEKKIFSLGVIEVSIFLGAINLLFLCFILIQLMYLFGGEDSIVAQGFTYAEYARKGFFELIVVAILSLLILGTTEQCLPKKETMHHTMPFKILSGMLVMEVIVIMLSAFTRLSLYEGAYGFTTLRLYSHAFIVFLSVVFLILLYKICVDTRETIFAHRMFLAMIAFLVCMNLLNPDAFIAQNNIALHAESPEEKLDLDYLSELSADAVPTMIDMLPADSPALQQWQSYNNEFAPWQSTHIARLKAKSFLGTLDR